MKKILLVSSQWAPKNQTGLGFASLQHESYFKQNGYKVKTVSLNDYAKDFNLKIKNKLNFILNLKNKIKEIKNIIEIYKPDIIVAESLQSIISEIFLIYGFKFNCKTILISHGVSIIPYVFSLKYILRSTVYIFYLPILFYITRNIDILFSLKKKQYDLRHLDTIFFLKFNKKKIIKKFNNISRFEDEKLLPSINSFDKYFLCIGYLDEIKNQEKILEIAKKNKDLNFRLIYSSYNKFYFNKLKKKKLKYKINNVVFLHSDNVDIKNEIKNCVSIINTSLTEVQPLSILEGLSLGKIFFSMNIKNLMHLKCGVNNKNLKQFIFNLKSLKNNKNFKKEIENSILDYYLSNFSTKKNIINFKIDET